MWPAYLDIKLCCALQPPSTQHSAVTASVTGIAAYVIAPAVPSISALKPSPPPPPPPGLAAPEASLHTVTRADAPPIQSVPIELSKEVDSTSEVEEEDSETETDSDDDAEFDYSKRFKVGHGHVGLLCLLL